MTRIMGVTIKAVQQDARTDLSLDNHYRGRQQVRVGSNSALERDIELDDFTLQLPTPI